MKTTVTARHFDLTDAIVQHIDEKVEQYKNHFTQALEAEFVLSYESHHERHIAEVKVHSPGDTFHSKIESDDMYKSIDQLIHKVITHLDKKKDKSVK